MLPSQAENSKCAHQNLQIVRIFGATNAKIMNICKSVHIFLQNTLKPMCALANEGVGT